MKSTRKMLAKIRHLFPSILPTTRDEIDAFIADILTTHDLPDDKSYHHAVAGAIMHLGPVTASKSKRWFARSVRKSIANQVAYQKIKSLQDDERKAMEQEFISKEATQVEATLTDGPIV